MDIAILLYDKVVALDAIGPYEVLDNLPGAAVTFVATEPGPKRTERGSLALIADRALHELPHPDVVVVPGAVGTPAPVADVAVHAWLQAAHQAGAWVASVCSGALILGAAGLLRGKRATTNWLERDRLPAFGAVPLTQRFVVDGRVVTAAGVTAGIDMALGLAARLVGDEIAQTIQLGLEYDPQPPFDAGSPHKAPAGAVASLRAWRQRVLAG
jgi:transcriptional regulator GlxA family with amidase domain